MYVVMEKRKILSQNYHSLSRVFVGGLQTQQSMYILMTGNGFGDTTRYGQADLSLP